MRKRISWPRGANYEAGGEYFPGMDGIFKKLLAIDRQRPPEAS